MQQLAMTHVKQREHCIDIRLAQSFDEDDVESIAESLIQRHLDARTIENISGADRFNARFILNSSTFVLNFEIYSQSCWIDIESSELNNDFYHILTTLQQHIR
ncbi:DUF3630 family protein [Thalassotalea euphylliae]|uniref:DUF3630 family protein n=1 Tax=Thalassotalea euphylliae TaxID=1655234 RepID=UPI003627F622